MAEFNLFQNKFFKSDAFSIITNLKFVIYGKFLRNAILGNESHIINIYGKESMQNVLETMLSKYISKSTSITSSSITGVKNRIVNYSIQLDNLKYVLDVVYVNDLQIDNIDYFLGDLNIIIDLDILAFKWNSLYILPDSENEYLRIKEICNYTLISVLENIMYKRFRIIKKMEPLIERELLYLKDLIDEGYQNLDNKLEKYIYKYEEPCSICYEKNDMELTKLSCGHIFHKSCIKDCFEEFIKEENTGIFKCPYCQKKFFNYEIL